MNRESFYNFLDKQNLKESFLKFPSGFVATYDHELPYECRWSDTPQGYNHWAKVCDVWLFFL